MNVSVAAGQKKFIDSLVKTGRYVTTSEVVREGLRLLQEREYVQNLREEEIRKQVQEGIDALDRGDYLQLDREGLKAFFDKVKRDGLRRLKARRRQK